jgi:hypothetical protein
MTAFPFAVWTDLALRTGEMLLASGQVIGHRTKRIAAAGHSPGLRDRREFTLMGLEKLEAAGESWWAMGQHLATMNWQLVARAWQDAMAAGMAWMAFGNSRTLPQLMQRQFDLSRSWTQAAQSAGRLSDTTARMAGKGLKPIHARATANARRLGGRRA